MVQDHQPMSPPNQAMDQSAPTTKDYQLISPLKQAMDKFAPAPGYYQTTSPPKQNTNSASPATMSAAPYSRPAPWVTPDMLIFGLVVLYMWLLHVGATVPSAEACGWFFVASVVSVALFGGYGAYYISNPAEQPPKPFVAPEVLIHCLLLVVLYMGYRAVNSTELFELIMYGHEITMSGSLFAGCYHRYYFPDGFGRSG